MMAAVANSPFELHSRRFQRPGMASSHGCQDVSNITVDAMPRITGPSSMGALTPSVSEGLVSLQESQLDSFRTGELSLGGASGSISTTVVHHAPTNIMIQGGQGHHIGDKHVRNLKLNIGQPKKKSKSKKKEIAQDVLSALLKSPEAVTCTHLKNVRIGKSWRMVMRELGLSDPDIDNYLEQFFHAGGIEEVIYQLLRLWVESNGSQATLGKLSKALWSEKQINGLNALAVAFGIISPPPEDV